MPGVQLEHLAERVRRRRRVLAPPEHACDVVRARGRTGGAQSAVDQRHRLFLPVGGRLRVGCDRPRQRRQRVGVRIQIHRAAQLGKRAGEIALLEQHFSHLQLERRLVLAQLPRGAMPELLVILRAHRWGRDLIVRFLQRAEERL